MENINLENAILYTSDRHGIYIPQYFAESIKPECLTNVSSDAMDILKAGPDHMEYWDAWNDVEAQATVTDPSNGIEYYLWQDGDLWLIPVNEMELV
jgi:hypothetical protein